MKTGISVSTPLQPTVAETLCFSAYSVTNESNSLYEDYGSTTTHGWQLLSIHHNETSGLVRTLKSPLPNETAHLLSSISGIALPLPL